LVAFSPTWYPDPNAENASNTTVAGIVMIIVSQFFSATQFIIEAKLLKGYDLDPFMIVGTEGLAGFLIYLCILPILGSIGPCGPPYCS